jgi:oligosaccharyltransferase complex subunit beta
MIEHFLNEGGVKSNITNPKIYRVKNEVVSNSCLA